VTRLQLLKKKIPNWSTERKRYIKSCEI
jgi:hypothetical protein